jgi:hypothetical protein
MFNSSTNVSWHLSDKLTIVVNKYEHKSMNDCSIYIKYPSSHTKKITLEQLMEHIHEYKTTQNPQNQQTQQTQQNQQTFKFNKSILFITRKKNK